MRKIKVAFLLLSSVFLVSCALVSNVYQKPDIELTHLQSIDRKGLDQVIIVYFKIENPTNEDLHISRFSYRLALENIEQISGVIHGLKPIPAFGKTQVQFKVTMNIFSAFRVLESAIKNKDGVIRYDLVTKVSSVWWKLPVVSEKSGQVNLADKYNL
jgi:LEA14-like dessication related protein|tara:strand:- start:5499 stop:5969 length:471 start_codon:yes stop_codon:yes gene_type:complete